MRTLTSHSCPGAQAPGWHAPGARRVGGALCKNLHNGVWNFDNPAPLYAAQVLVLRSLSCLRAVTETLERFSSLPLFFVSGRFATFFLPLLPILGGGMGSVGSGH